MTNVFEKPTYYDNENGIAENDFAIAALNTLNGGFL